MRRGERRTLRRIGQSVQRYRPHSNRPHSMIRASAPEVSVHWTGPGSIRAKVVVEGAAGRVSDRPAGFEIGDNAAPGAARGVVASSRVGLDGADSRLRSGRLPSSRREPPPRRTRAGLDDRTVGNGRVLTHGRSSSRDFRPTAPSVLRRRSDVSADWIVTDLVDPFPTPLREERTRPRGRFRLSFRL